MNERVEAWPEHLIAFLSERRGRPFAWGSNDCCLFAADWIRTATGYDPAAKVRGTYSTFLGALLLNGNAEGVKHLA